MNASVEGRVRRVSAAMRSVPGLGIWLGVVLGVAGLTLIAVAWGGTAGTTDVAAQLPWVVGAGLPGLGLIVVGLAVISTASKRRDAALRTEQLRELTVVLAEIRSLVERRR